MFNRVAILKGGFSDEADVSRASAVCVEEALKIKGYQTISVEIDNNFLNWVEKNKSKVDVFFNSLHGTWGEDGKLQGLLEYIKVPYTHSGVTASAIGMNKQISKKIFMQENIPVPRGLILNKKNTSGIEKFKRPFVIKPIMEGSSLGINIISNNTDLQQVIFSKWQISYD